MPGLWMPRLLPMRETQYVDRDKLLPEEKLQTLKDALAAYKPKADAGPDRPGRFSTDNFNPFSVHIGSPAGGTGVPGTGDARTTEGHPRTAHRPPMPELRDLKRP